MATNAPSALRDLPECALGTNAEILENEPDADVIRRVAEAEGACCQTPNEIPCEHALRLVAHHCYPRRTGAVAWRNGNAISIELNHVCLRGQWRHTAVVSVALVLRVLRVLREVLLWRAVGSIWREWGRSWHVESTKRSGKVSRMQRTLIVPRLHLIVRDVGPCLRRGVGSVAAGCQNVLGVGAHRRIPAIERGVREGRCG